MLSTLGLLLGWVLLANAWVLRVGSRRVCIPDQVVHAPVALVLGARVFPDGSVSHVLQDRLDTAGDLLRLGAVDRLLLSGAPAEVDAMAAHLKEWNVPDGCLLRDDAGLETWASMHRARMLGVDRVVVVTQGFHLPRALFLARLAGLEAQGVAADRRRYAHRHRQQAREVAARAKAFLRLLQRRVTAGPPPPPPGR